MKKFYVDFKGYCVIEAETEADAERIFWEKLPSISDSDVWDVQNIEEAEDECE